MNCHTRRCCGPMLRQDMAYDEVDLKTLKFKANLLHTTLVAGAVLHEPDVAVHVMVC